SLNCLLCYNFHLGIFQSLMIQHSCYSVTISMMLFFVWYGIVSWAPSAWYGFFAEAMDEQRRYIMLTKG
ncbi:hypothetical protein ACJX0J_018803, partial [Zea mays]